MWFSVLSSDRWNQLDMGIVILSIVGIVLEEMKSNVIPINPTIIRVMRVLRIARGETILSLRCTKPKITWNTDFTCVHHR